ncbi:MAG: hypothetical protein U1D30_01000 [Planctomycetota bacterium]
MTHQNVGMAKNEADREDLFREASGLYRRVELTVLDEIVVAGFRRHGGLTIYFGQDFMLGFNAAGELRRALLHARLYRAEKGRELTELQRQRDTEGNPILLARTMIDDDVEGFKRIVAEQLSILQNALTEEVKLSRIEPPNDSRQLVGEIRQIIEKLLENGLPVADGM